MIYQGDAESVLKNIPPYSAQCVVTSPPYLGMGLVRPDETLEEYLDAIVRIFKSVRVTLNDDGVVWLLLGDSYDKSSLTGFPWSVASALLRDGWRIRSDVIWAKDVSFIDVEHARSSILGANRPAKSHEHLFMLTKNKSYSYHGDAVRQGGHNLKSVWVIPKEPAQTQFATFPPVLVETCIAASTKEGDLVIDPFCGSGMTGVVAQRMGREFTGIEINPEYVEMARSALTDSSYFDRVGER